MRCKFYIWRSYSNVRIQHCMRLHLTLLLLFWTLRFKPTPKPQIYSASTPTRSVEDYPTPTFFFSKLEILNFFCQWATKIQGLAIGPVKSLFNRLKLTCLSGSSSPIFLMSLVPCKKTCAGSSSRTEILLANNISLNPCQVLLFEPACKTWEGFVSHSISYTSCWKPLKRHTLHS